jgi:hypothetical protein
MFRGCLAAAKALSIQQHMMALLVGLAAPDLGSTGHPNLAPLLCCDLCGDAGRCATAIRAQAALMPE